MDNKIKILHIDTGKKWRGGQQQVAYLFEGLLKQNYQTALVCKPNSLFSEFCKKKDYPFFTVKMRSEFDIFSAYQIAKICKKNSFNILHLHTAHALSIGLFTKLFYPKLILIAVRRVDLHIRKNFLSKSKYSNKLLDKIVTISDGIKNILLQNNVEEKRIVTIHSGIDTEKFSNVHLEKSFYQKYNPNNKIVVGTISAFADCKDYPNLLNVAKILLQKYKNLLFIALGDGSKKDEIFALHKKLGLKENFIFAGFQKDVGKFLKLFDIFVLASKQEGLGTSILDAQAVGLPIAATNVGGIPEVVLDNINGFTVEAQNSQVLADAIIKLAKDRVLRKKLGAKGKKTVQNFSIKETIKKNIALYKSLVK